MHIVKQKKILFINVGWEQFPTIKFLKKTGCKIYGICFQKKINHKEYFEKVLHCRLDQINEIINYTKKINPDGIISDQCDFSYLIHSKIAKKFNLIGPKIKDAKLFTDKIYQRKLLSKSKLKTPAFFSTKKYENAHIKLKKIESEKIVIKPSDNRGGIGVNIIKKKKFDKKIFFKSIIHSKSKNLIFEEFIDGDHYNLDGMVINNKCKLLGISYNQKMKNKIINKYLYYDQNLLKKKKLINFFYKLCNVFKPKFGLIHAEIIIDKQNNIYLTEIANRGGGIRISNTVLSRICGYNINDYLIKISLKKKIKLKKTIEKSKAILIKFLPIRKKINNLNYKTKNLIFFKKLTNYKAITDSSRRNFMIIAEGENMAKINNTIKKTLIKII